MSFFEELKKTLDNEFNTSVTENGAVGYRTTGKELLDLNFAVSSLRNMSDFEVVKRFARAYFDGKELAVKWLFFAGDVRGGMGERRLFRLGLLFLAHYEPELCARLIPLVPEYTRWDNLWCLLDTPLCDKVCALVKRTLDDDLAKMSGKKPVSLLAKWLPSANTSSKKTRAYARIIMNKLGYGEREYRKTLSALRAYADVVEVKMSSDRWNKIKYSAVPSRANVIYKDAFLLHDEKRRKQYLAALKNGETKINSGVLFPHDIVNKYCTRCGTLSDIDVALEQMWKALPDYVKGDDTTICVTDGSGSMTSCVGGGRLTCLTVANALTVYFAERCKGAFENKYITFSERPKLVDFSKCDTLRDKITVAYAHSEVANTNIEAVFDLILRTAVRAKMKQSDLPANVLVLSDMEFDYCVEGKDGKLVTDRALFDVIAEKYAEHGYKLPRLVFWNICSRTGTIPVRENALGVALVSGFSPAVVEMVLGGKLDPYECLLDRLASPRYDAVDAILKNKK